MTKTTQTPAWVRNITADLRRAWGPAFDRIGDDFREGIIARAVLSAVAASASHCDVSKQIAEAWQAARREMNPWNHEEQS